MLVNSQLVSLEASSTRGALLLTGPVPPGTLAGYQLVNYCVACVSSADMGGG